MTTLAAVKKGSSICLASDSLSMFGSRKEISNKHVYDDGKILKIGPNLVGMTGHVSWNLILADYFARQKRIPVWKTADQIFDLFNGMHQELKERYYLNPPNLKFLPFESSEFHLLIVNTYGIFEVDYARVVRQFSKYAAIGTGEDYALGAISAVYEEIENAEEIAKIGIEAAVQFDRKSGLPVYTRCV